MWTSSIGRMEADTSPKTSKLERERLLVEELRAGSEESYEILVREYGGPMLAVARRLLRNEHDAQDALQDALFQVLRSIHAFRGQSSLATWLHRIVRNTALLKIRGAQRHPETSLDALLPVYDETGHRVGAGGPTSHTPESELEASDLRAHVRACVGRLPLRYRSVLVLRDLEGWSTQETARTLGVSPNVAKVRLHRARRALATLVAERLPELSSKA